MNIDKLKKLYAKYDLVPEDVFKHNHYTIITRQGIDKIQAVENIFISYVVVFASPEYCAVKALAKKEGANIETFGSAKYGGKEWQNSDNGGKGKWIEHGNTNSWYVLEIAEKRAMSRAVLKLTGFYELGVFGEDESEDFNRGGNINESKIKTPSEKLKECTNLKQLASVFSSLTRTEKVAMESLKNELKDKLK